MLLALVGLLAPILQAHAQASLESAIEATFLLKFPPFITWHQGLPPDSFTVCVLGDSPVTGLLRQAAAGLSVDQHPVRVRHVSAATASSGCQELYLAGSDPTAIATALAATRGTPVLTVTDGQTDPTAKGILNFVLTDGHVRFEVDLNAAAANGISISSKLLSIAVHVNGSAH
ncbi:MAG TPA: YfiR family protein [Acetobacteraceae bacterium]|nr:YfiR family protein [Acetobacteraceae bacterium]